MQPPRAPGLMEHPRVWLKDRVCSRYLMHHPPLKNIRALLETAHSLVWGQRGTTTGESWADALTLSATHPPLLPLLTRPLARVDPRVVRRGVGCSGCCEGGGPLAQPPTPAGSCRTRTHPGPCPPSSAGSRTPPPPSQTAPGQPAGTPPQSRTSGRPRASPPPRAGASASGS